MAQMAQAIKEHQGWSVRGTYKEHFLFIRNKKYYHLLDI